MVQVAPKSHQRNFKLSSLACTKEDYRDDHQVMRDLLNLIVESLDQASREGVPLASGGKLHPIPLGNKGDWPYLASWSDYIIYHSTCGFHFCFDMNSQFRFMCCQKSSKASSANLVRSFRNVPKAAESRTDCTGICHLCLSGRPHYDYEDVLLIPISRETFLP